MKHDLEVKARLKLLEEEGEAKQYDKAKQVKELELTENEKKKR